MTINPWQVTTVKLVSHIWCFSPWSSFRFYTLFFPFSPLIVFEIVFKCDLEQDGCWLALLWLCESLLSIFLKEGLDEMESKRGRKKMSGGMPRGEGGQNLGCIVVCFPTVDSRRKWNGAAKYTNSTMKWWAWSSCGTRLSPCSGRWNACEYLLFKLEGQSDTSNHVFREKLRLQEIRAVNQISLVKLRNLAH